MMRMCSTPGIAHVRHSFSWLRHHPPTDWVDKGGRIGRLAQRTLRDLRRARCR